MRPFIQLSLVIVTLCTASCASEEKPLTKEEAIDFAHRLDSVVVNRQYNAFKDFIDAEALAERVAEKMDIKASSAFKRGLNKGIQTSFGKELIGAANGKNGFYEFVKHYERDKVHHVIFRLYGLNGLNYHDYELAKHDNKVAAVDIYIYMTGENLSKTMADLGINSTGEKSANPKAQAIQQLSEVKSLLAQNKHQEAKEIFDKLPADLRRQKGSQIYYLQICSGLDEELYVDALNQYEVRYRHEPDMYLSLVDLYFLRKQYDKVLDAINKIDSQINKDSFLDFYRGVAYSYMDQQENAKNAFANIYKSKPQFGEGLRNLIICYMNLGDYDGVKPLIATYRNNEKFDQEVLNADLAVYPGFEEN